MIYTHIFSQKKKSFACAAILKGVLYEGKGRITTKSRSKCRIVEPSLFLTNKCIANSWWRLNTAAVIIQKGFQLGEVPWHFYFQHVW